jgi:hypothetical protein
MLMPLRLLLSPWGLSAFLYPTTSQRAAPSNGIIPIILSAILHPKVSAIGATTKFDTAVARLNEITNKPLNVGSSFAGNQWFTKVITAGNTRHRPIAYTTRKEIKIE